MEKLGTCDNSKFRTRKKNEREKKWEKREREGMDLMGQSGGCCYCHILSCCYNCIAFACENNINNLFCYFVFKWENWNLIICIRKLMQQLIEMRIAFLPNSIDWLIDCKHLMRWHDFRWYGYGHIWSLIIFYLFVPFKRAFALIIFIDWQQSNLGVSIEKIQELIKLIVNFNQCWNVNNS